MKDTILGEAYVIMGRTSDKYSFFLTDVRVMEVSNVRLIKCRRL